MVLACEILIVVAAVVVLIEAIFDMLVKRTPYVPPKYFVGRLTLRRFIELIALIFLIGGVILFMAKDELAIFSIILISISILAYAIEMIINIAILKAVKKVYKKA